MAYTFLGCLALSGCDGCRRQELPHPPAAFQPSAEAIAKHNEAVALMGQFDYSTAHDIFAELAAAHPEWEAVQVDLAIATLNRQQVGDSERARQLLGEILQQHPDNLRAYYCRGILDLDGGDPEAASKMFQHVAQADPTDAYAAYYAGQCLAQLGKPEEALPWFVKAIEMDPYLRSALYGAFQACLRLDKQQQATEFRELFQRLETNPQARVAEIKYTRMGPRAEVSSATSDIAPVGPPPGDLFRKSVALPGTDAKLSSHGQRTPNLTVCDMNQDGHLDLFIASASAVEREYNTVFFGGENGFQLAKSHPLAAVSQVNTAAWGDFDNDGAVDVYLLRSGPNSLWRQLADGQWLDITEMSETGGADINSTDGMAFDADHDGDLDLFVANDGPNELFNNNLNGTFRPLAEAQGIAGNGATREIIASDFDHDRDVDLIAINQHPPHEVYRNNRLWNYEPATGFDEFIKSPIQACLATDRDVDGQVELVTLGKSGLAVWRSEDQASWQSTPLGIARTDLSPPLATSDLNGNGTNDLIVSTNDSWLALAADGKRELARFPNKAPWRLANLDAAKGPSVIAVKPDATPIVWQPGPGRLPFIMLQFTGKEDQGEQMRSNRSGIGVSGAVRMGTDWAAFDTFRADSGPGQSWQPISVGTGGRGRIDYVKMTWPDGVFQTELGLTSGLRHVIEEDQRQVASCPVIFAWDGQQYRFITDALGVAGIGFNVGYGEYGDPRPWENLQLPSNLLKARQDKFEIKIGEPMEEVCYLDAARLVCYDLPPGWQMVIDERFHVLGPPPSGQPIFYRHEHLPIAATNDRGQDLLALLKTADFQAAQPGQRDSRFLGLNKAHDVILEFSISLDQPDLYLMMDGWIEYPYSQTMFAAWQADASYDAPTIEVEDTDGVWHIVTEQFGYLAGMPRRALLPLDRSRIPAGAKRLRIRTNVEIYWDRIALIQAETNDTVRVKSMPLRQAVVDEVGFARRTNLAQHRPHYDYNQRAPLWDTRHLKGHYTSFGEATPLVTTIDDAVAIIGPGEEVELRFSDQSEQLPTDWSRTFVLELNGWCKDMDLYTRDGATVAPLPRRHPTKNPAELQQRDQLHQQFNQRFRSGF